MRLIDATELKRSFSVSSIVNDGKTIEQIIDEQPTITPEQRWIPCNKQLPKDNVEVFVYLFERPTPYIAWVKERRWYTEDFEVEKEYYPMAWMPLPQPYRGVNNG